MDTKKIIIAIIIIVAVVCVGVVAYSLTGAEIEYTTLQVSSNCVLSVPVSNDASSSTDSYGIFYYQDKQHNLNISSYNTQDHSSLGGAAQFATSRDTQLLGCKPVIEEGITYYLNEKTGVYNIYITDETSHNNILISCSDLEIVKHIVASFNDTDIDKNETADNSTSSSKAETCDHEIEGPDCICIKCGKQLKEGDRYNGGQVLGPIDYSSPQYSGYDDAYVSDDYYYDGGGSSDAGAEDTYST